VIGDLRTMFWKEWRSLVSGPARRQMGLTAGILAVLWAVLFPIQMGRHWVTDAVPLVIVSVALPMAVAGVVVPDAFAGERERHTLPTLLASRLPDRAILYGKLGFGVLVGWLSLPLVLAVSLVTVNVWAGRGEPLLYDPVMLLFLLALGMLIAVLTGGIGIFVSLRARTAQEAQQLTLVGLMVPLMILGFALTMALADRELARSVLETLSRIDAGLVALGAMAIIVVLDVFVVAAADRRFRRGRLMAS
jgi:ABC-2 type transport system permease protein